MALSFISGSIGKSLNTFKLWDFGLDIATHEKRIWDEPAHLVDWKMFLRDVCAEHFVNHPVRIGGVGRAVEIDESVFTRRKYNHGRMVREPWVFGGIDTTTKEGFMVPVDRRDANTLLPIIQNYILPGTNILPSFGKKH